MHMKLTNLLGLGFHKIYLVCTVGQQIQKITNKPLFD